MKTVSQYAQMIEASISALPLEKQPTGLYSPIHYALEAGGKRLRPVLTLSVSDALGCNPEKAINQAIGIEMFHNFTLLHDDVMDKADVRRGRPTVHRKYSESTAILSGDAMLTLAGSLIMKECPDCKLRTVLDLFNKTAIEIYEGQQYDMDFETRSDVTTEEYLEMIRLKTSVLLGCSCAMGAIIADADDKTITSFYSFGEKLGLSFQLKDDWLDTYGNPETFGKAIGGDIANEKKTWLLITAMAEDRSGVLSEVIGKNIAADQKIDKVRGVYDSLNLSERCRELEERFAKDAIDSLNTVNMSMEAKEYFTNLALNSLKRTK
ncbi:MAG: polyprenyl synthetase family protein [Paramuribaculum sp.]|nr:polyprenyl synthetase family protein [Paramuribaculum sp.]